MNIATTETTRTVKKIPASLQHFGNRARVLTRKLNTTGYARVSTKLEQQEDSYERQVDYYSNYIKNKPDWNYVEMYSDPGITGTKAHLRPGFMKMIEDCRKGLIDKILVKNIPRFARNTVDALTYIRELKELGVSVVFENEGIDTLTPGGDILITILAGMAEQEVRNISLNIKWAFKKKFEKGEILMSTKFFLGYTRDKDNNIIVEPREALIVQRIFREYIGGFSTMQISNRLNAEGVTPPMGATKRKGGREGVNIWYSSTVRSIIRNEKYTGNAIMGKTYKPDVISPKRIRNDGQEEKFYIENSHLSSTFLHK